MLTSWMTGTSFGGTAPGHRSTSEACNDFCSVSTRRGGWSGATRWSGSRGWRGVTKTSTSRCSVATPASYCAFSPRTSTSGRTRPGHSRQCTEGGSTCHRMQVRSGPGAVRCRRGRSTSSSPKSANGNWVWRHDPTVTMTLADLTWMDDAGVRFARPEVVLAHKAKWRQPKDDLDFDAAWPLLDARARAWLRATVTRMYPGHGWLPRMD